ncbi:LysR family transcriptional regulator, partial [Ramlibacter sp.]|uniref:LysR family transcriptional regulator n=1 Tax=Ramlibacter sp. TaxID=1917967 RepID=UPI003D10AF32
LEEILGVSLFDRSVRPPALTLVGTSVLRCARDVSAKVRELEDTARQGASGRVPLLRIGMLDSFTSTAGAAMLSHLNDAALEWTVTSGFKGTSMQALIDREADVIVTSDERLPAGVVALPLLTESFVLVLPMSWRGPVDDIRAIAADIPFIRYGRDSHMGATIQSYLARAGAEAKVRHQFDTTDAAVRMVAAGFGWTIMTPLIYLKSMVSSVRARVAPLPGNPIHRTIVVAMRANEGEDLHGRIRDAALAALGEVVQPQIEKILPQCADLFRVARRTTARTTGKTTAKATGKATGKSSRVRKI